MNNLVLNISPRENQTDWDNTDGVIDDFAHNPLKVISAGELVYIGTSLHDLVAKKEDEKADYAIRTRIIGTENLQLDLRVRRQDENNFIALKMDFSTDIIKIVKVVGGTESTLNQASHDFKFSGKNKYDFEIRMLDRALYGFVNGFNIVTASTKEFRTEPGLSLYFPTVDIDNPFIFSFSANETEAFPDPATEGIDDIYLTFRISIKQQIEDPSERTWDTYVKAVKFYEQRNVGMPDASWEFLGYPIQKPSAEEWFGNLP